jgi:hypothetical protein
VSLINYLDRTCQLSEKAKINREKYHIMNKNIAAADFDRLRKRKTLKRIKSDGRMLDETQQCQLKILDGWFKDDKVTESRAAARRGISQRDTSEFYDLTGLAQC